ncbi:MAG: PQQ-binding-like beta-propeller repeat protein [Actinomycetales bacterium]|nr:PQQ-binding-like beta-propeller repeat protein [Actinomycetales bacterium]
MGIRGSKAEVELSEDVSDGEGLPDGQPVSDGEDAGRRPGRGWRAVGWLLVIAVVVGGALFVVESRRDAAAAEHEALIASQDGGIFPLSDGLTELWRTPEGHLYAGTGPGMVLVERADELVALDAQTGAELWSAAAAEEHSYCETPAGATDVLACRADSKVRWLDPATGSLLAERDVSGYEAASAWRDGLVLVSDHGTTVQLFVEGQDRGVRWDVTALDRPLAEGEGVALAVGAESALAVVADRVVAVDAAGEVLADLPAPVDEEAAVGPAPIVTPWITSRGAFTVQGFDGSEQRTLVLDAAGEVRVDEPAGTWLFSFDDGSLGNITAVSGWDGTQVRDLEDGSTLATFPSAPLFVVDGAVVRMAQGRLASFDVESGTERWAVDIGFGYPIGTDGEVVLVVGAPGLTSTLRAIDLDTGGERWAFELPDPESSPVAISGMLLEINGESVIRLG